MDVVPLASVQPKRLEKRYKNTNYVIEYDPNTKKWRWVVTFIQEVRFPGEAKTIIEAQRAAERHIEKTLKLRGKS